MNRPHLWMRIVTFGALTTLGCAHSPPNELIEARAAYHQASGSSAARETPAQLHTAHNALERAEASFKEEGDSEQTRDLSYVATRKAQLAEVQARVQESENRLAQLESTMSAQTRAELDKLRGKYQTQQQQLAASQAALDEANRRAAQATADLARIANVKQDTRGTVITLSGEVLFTSGKAELLPSAQAKLDQVATALTQQNKTANIVVEGFTDSSGSPTFNMDLSTRRAQTVRDYLAAHGVAADRISAQGYGESQPIGNNETPEGRANNRRVEIVVKPPQADAQATAS